jgi:RimJ/RimL family protein N-acetyltransferase
VSTKLSIKTPRLIVDEFTPQDLPALTGIFERMAQAGQHWYNADPQDPASIQAFLDKVTGDRDVAPRHTYRMAVRMPDAATGTSQLIGYVSLCDIFSKTAGTPDTGVFIDPQFQRGRYAREARIAIMVFGFMAGIETMYSDIAIDNTGSKQNVLGMGYEYMLDAQGQPELHQVKTLTGTQPVHRFILTRDTFWQILPALTQDLMAKIGAPSLSAAMNGAAQPPQIQAESLPAPFHHDLGPFTVKAEPHAVLEPA